jgi:long-chain acyl-CoA synthetase
VSQPAFPAPIPAIPSLLASGNAQAVHYAGRWYGGDWMVATAKAVFETVGPGAAIALVARNRPAHVAVMAGALDAGRALTMVHSAQSPVRLAADIERLRRPVVVAEREDWSEEALAAAGKAGSMAIALADGHDCSAVAVLLQRGTGPFLEPQPGTALELLSSGTTGAPKQVPLSRETVARTLAASGTMYAGSQGARPQIMAAPLGNISGLGYAMPPLMNRQPLILLGKFEPQAWAAAIREFKPARGALPPAGVRMMLDSDVPAEWLASLEVVGMGGGKVEPHLLAAFEERFRVPVTPAYGATEFAGVVAAWTLDLYREFGAEKRGSAGRAIPSARLRVVDGETGEALAAGKHGLLEVQAERIGPGWIRTTDLAHIDADGFLFLHGRADGAINRGGFKVLPETIAEALCTHPAVADAAALGISDVRLGEVPVAAVELVPGSETSVEELRAFLSDRLLAYQQPVDIRILDALPRNPSLKVALADLKVLFS